MTDQQLHDHMPDLPEGSRGQAPSISWKELVQRSSNEIFVLDKTFRIWFLNEQARKAFTAITGFAGKMEGLSFLEIVQETRKHLVEQVLHRVLAGEELSYETMFTIASGEDFWFFLNYRPLLDPENNVTGICITANNISVMKNSETELKKSEQRWKFALEGGGDGVWEYNYQTGESYYSPLYKNILGFSDEEFPNEVSEWRDRIHPEDRVKVENIDRLYHDGSIQFHSIEYRLRTRTDDYVWVLDRGMIVERGPDGRAVKLVGTQKDITLARNAEEALRQSEERYYQMVDSVADYAILLLNQEGVILNWNKGAEKIKGYKPWEIVGKSFEEFYTDADRKSGVPKRILQEALRDGRSVNEGWRKRKDGSHFWASVTISLVKDRDNKFMGFTKVTRDLTDKKAAEDKLINSEYQFSSFMANTTTMNWIIDERNVFRYMNSAYMKAFNLTFEDIGKDIYTIFPAAICDEFVTNNWKVWDSGNSMESYENGVGPDGKKQLYHSFKFPLPMDHGVRLLGGVSLDITQEKELERQLAEEEEQRKREIIQAIIEAQEKERRKLAYELHDNVNQILTSSRLMLEVAAEKPESWKQFVQNSLHYLQMAISEIRKLSHSLTPSTLVDISLEAAIEEIIDDLNKTGKINIAYQKKLRIPTRNIGPEIQLTVMRILQEQLNNVINHAGADLTVVILQTSAEHISLLVEDDGRGFEPTSTKKGIGLNGIINRVEFYGGLVVLRSAPGKGCRLEIAIPLPPAIV